MRSHDRGHSHVDFEAPLRAYLKARDADAIIIVPPDDELSHPASGLPCRTCWRVPRGKDGGLEQRVMQHLKTFGRAMEAINALKETLGEDLVALAREAQKTGRGDLVAALQGSARGGSE